MLCRLLVCSLFGQPEAVVTTDVQSEGAILECTLDSGVIQIITPLAHTHAHEWEPFKRCLVVKSNHAMRETAASASLLRVFLLSLWASF